MCIRDRCRTVLSFFARFVGLWPWNAEAEAGASAAPPVCGGADPRICGVHHRKSRAGQGFQKAQKCALGRVSGLRQAGLCGGGALVGKVRGPILIYHVSHRLGLVVHVTRGEVGVIRRVVGATRGGVGVIRGVVGATRGGVGVTRGVVGVTRGVVGVTRGGVGATRGDVGATRGVVGLTRGDVGVTRGGVGVIEGGVGVTAGGDYGLCTDGLLRPPFA